MIKVYAIKFWGDEDYLVCKSLSDIVKIIEATEKENPGEGMDLILRIAYIDEEEYEKMENA
jgi:hypothetical protein